MKYYFSRMPKEEKRGRLSLEKSSFERLQEQWSFGIKSGATRSIYLVPKIQKSGISSKEQSMSLSNKKQK